MLVIDGADPGLHCALLVGALDHLALVVERAARQACYLQQRIGNPTASAQVLHMFGASQGCTLLAAGVISQAQLPEIFRYDPFLAVTGAALPRSVGQTAVATTYQLTR